jgi:hypothetical protein
LVIAGSRFDADPSFGRQKTRPDPDHADHVTPITITRSQMLRN